MTMHFLDDRDLNRADQLDLPHTPWRIKHEGLSLGTPLAGKTLAMVMSKPSLRTRTSFTVATRRLVGRDRAAPRAPSWTRGRKVVRARTTGGGSRALTETCTATEVIIAVRADASRRQRGQGQGQGQGQNTTRTWRRRPW